MIDIQAGAAVLIVFRICLALFFITAAIGKLMNWSQFARGVLDYRILPATAARLLALILPWIELTVGLGLVVGAALPVSSLVSAALLGSFLVVVLINLHRGVEISCSCFGIASTRTLGWGAVARNSLLLSMAVATVAFSSGVVPQARLTTSAALSSADVNGLASIVLTTLLVISITVLIILIDWGLDIHFRTVRLARIAARHVPRSSRATAEAGSSTRAAQNGHVFGFGGQRGTTSGAHKVGLEELGT